MSYGSETSDMTSERLGEMFKGDSEDTFAGNFRSCRWGDERTRQACADGERGPPSARAEIIQKVEMSLTMHFVL